MSRAFVKETDGDDFAGELPARARSDQPCYITLSGLAALRAEYERLVREAKGSEVTLDEQTRQRGRRLRLHELEGLFAEAIPIDVAAQSSDDIRFGAIVTLRDEHGNDYRFQIVGEDESAPAHGRISWRSPLGRALIGRRAGDAISWQRPAGALDLEVISFSFT